MVRYLITVIMALTLLLPAGVKADTLTYNAGPNGTINPAGPQSVNAGKNAAAVTATPDTGYHFFNWSWPNAASTSDPFGTTDNPFTFTADGVDHAFTATFVANPSTELLITHGLSDARVVLAGETHTAVLRNNGTVVIWGGGDGQSSLSGTTGVKAIGVGDFQTLLLKDDGTVLASGIWSTYQGKNNVKVIVPPELATNASAHGGVVALTGGDSHSVALMADGTVFVWGDNSYGQTVIPSQLSGKVVTAIAAGHNHTVAITSDNTVVAWGSRFHGELSFTTAQLLNPPYQGVVNVAYFDSDAANTPSVHVTTFTNGTTLTAVDARAYHTAVLTGTGKVICWGADELGQSDVPASLVLGSNPSVKATAIALGGHHTVALTNAGTLISWGGNYYGQISPPAGLTGFTSIAAGSYHTLALLGNHAAVAWGKDDAGQCDVPAEVYQPMSDGSVACTPNGVSPDFVPYNADSTCTITPASGYDLAAFILNGMPITVTGNSTTLAAVTSYQSISAVFAKPGATAPVAPTGVTGTAGEREALVTFTAPASDGGSAITGYTVTSNSGGTDVNSGSTLLTHLVTGLTNGTSYTFTVTATNFIGTGSASEPSGTVTPKATATIALSGLTVTYDGTPKSVSYTTTPANLVVDVTYSGSPTAPTDAGSYQVVATVNDNLYQGSATATLTVQQASQTITFGPLGNQPAGTPPFTLSATSSSKLPVAFTSLTLPVCTVSGNIVTLVAPGTCTIEASQAGDNNFQAATSVSQSFTVTQGLSRFSISSIGSQTLGTPFAITVTALDASGNTDATFVGTADLTGSGGLALTPATTGSFTAGVWTGNVTIPSAASGLTITATRSGGTETGTSNAFNVGMLSQSITITTPAPTSANMGASFTVAASAPGGTVTYSSAGGCTNNGATFTMTGSSQTCTVLYDQAGNSTYGAATSLSSTTTLAASVPGAPALGTITVADGLAKVPFTAPASNGGSPIVSYLVIASPGNITATGTTSPIIVTGLTNGTAYTFTVAATNAAGTGPASTASAAMVSYPSGDLNADGVVDIKDAILALRISVGLDKPTAAMLSRGDVAPFSGKVPQSDGKMDVGDVVVILRRAVGLVKW